jgi:hypothetical protein
MADEDNFFARWSRRKVQAKDGSAPAPEAPPSPGAAMARAAGVAPLPASGATTPERSVLAPTVETAGEGPAAPQPLPLPTLADVAALTRDSDYTRFVVPGVDEGVKRAAMKKMFFSDPHFNIMDGLDVYIEDYNTPDPIPASMLRQMWQSKALGLFDDEAEDEAKSPEAARQNAAPEPPAAQAYPDGAAPPQLSQSAIEPAVPLDENPDLRLQPNAEPGRPGPLEGARTGRG